MLPVSKPIDLSDIQLDEFLTNFPTNFILGCKAAGVYLNKTKSKIIEGFKPNDDMSKIGIVLLLFIL